MYKLTFDYNDDNTPFVIALWSVPKAVGQSLLAEHPHRSFEQFHAIESPSKEFSYEIFILPRVTKDFSDKAWHSAKNVTIEFGKERTENLNLIDFLSRLDRGKTYSDPKSETFNKSDVEQCIKIISRAFAGINLVVDPQFESMALEALANHDREIVIPTTPVKEWSETAAALNTFRKQVVARYDLEKASKPSLA